MVQLSIFFKVPCRWTCFRAEDCWCSITVWLNTGMRLGVALWRNLNLREWNRKVWEIGYRGPPLPKLKQ